MFSVATVRPVIISDSKTGMELVLAVGIAVHSYENYVFTVDGFSVCVND